MIDPVEGTVITVPGGTMVDQTASFRPAILGVRGATTAVTVVLLSGYLVDRDWPVIADRQHSLALDRLGRLSDANALLFALHRVAQSLPSSLDLDEVLDSTSRRVQDLFTYDVAAVLLFDETGGGWGTARTDGNRIPAAWADGTLPSPAAQPVRSRRLVHEPDLARALGPGLGCPTSCSSTSPCRTATASRPPGGSTPRTPRCGS